MNVRPLNATDAEDMAAVHATCFDRGWPALDMAVHLQRDLCFGAGDPVQSFCIVRCSDVDAELLTIATASQVRGQGLAAQILQRVRDALCERQLRQIFLEVAEDNLVARRLYERLGFRMIGRRPAYYRRVTGRVAAMTYELALNDPVSGSLDDSLVPR
jgi:ribosomal-protein-alanine N-acetyltransferase